MPPDTTQTENLDKLLGIARMVLESEIRAIEITEDCLDAEFQKAVALVLECTGNVIVSGLGKSGLIGQKLSATLASTGTPSHFLHPTEAVHGDLGRIRRGDIALLMSYSGSTDEVASLAAILRQDNVPIISMTKSANSQIGQLSDAALAVGDIAEACQNGLAPTSTTTAMMALGDALAIAASTQRNFSAEDFSRAHPGGALGKTMMPVSDMIRFEIDKNIAVSRPNQTIEEVLQEADRFPRRCGAILIADPATQKLLGILTDGDLRRLLIQHGTVILKQQAGDVMTKDPATICGSAPVRDAIQIVRTRRLDELPVVDEAGRPIGVLDVQDLIALKLIEND